MLRTLTEESITVGAAAVSLTANNVFSNPLPDEVEILVTGAPINVRQDGTAPTAAVGETVNPFSYITLKDRDRIANFQAIRTGGTSATLWVRYLANH